MRQSKARFIAVVTVSTSTILIIALLLSGCQALKTKKTTPVLIGGFSSPESVIADPASGRFFVSNVGEKLEPSTKDGDGFISLLSSDGVILTKEYLPKSGVLHAPKGMAIIDSTLYVTDIDRVVGFDIDTGDETFTLDFSLEKTVFLNDLAVLDDRTLLVSATDIGKIYKISLGKEPRFTVLEENIPGANGLYFDRLTQRLFVVSFGEGYEFNGVLGVISFKDDQPEYQKLTGQIGGLDGVALLPDGKLLFSDWVAFDKPGLMHVYDLRTKELSVFKLTEDVSSPADFLYDEKNNVIWLPKMIEGKILIERIK